MIIDFYEQLNKKAKYGQIKYNKNLIKDLAKYMGYDDETTLWVLDGVAGKGVYGYLLEKYLECGYLSNSCVECICKAHGIE